MAACLENGKFGKQQHPFSMMRFIINTVVRFGLALSATGLSVSSFATPGTSIVGLTCEHLSNPIGIDAPHPRFSWRVTTTKPSMEQHAYQLFVGTDSMGVATGRSVHKGENVLGVLLGNGWYNHQSTAV